MIKGCFFFFFCKGQSVFKVFLKKYSEFPGLSSCSTVSVLLMSTANGIFCSSGATAVLSTSLTQIRAYLLTSQRLSLSLTRPGQILGTQSGHFLCSSLEILLLHSRHTAVHRWGRRVVGGVKRVDHPLGAPVFCTRYIRTPLTFQDRLFFFVLGRCKIMSWPKNFDKATPNPLPPPLPPDQRKYTS